MVFDFLSPREESNLNLEFRKLMSYPLNDGGITDVPLTYRKKLQNTKNPASAGFFIYTFAFLIIAESRDFFRPAVFGLMKPVFAALSISE